MTKLDMSKASVNLFHISFYNLVSPSTVTEFIFMQDDPDGALRTCNEAATQLHRNSHVTGGSRPFGVYNDFLSTFDITRLLLIMLLYVRPDSLCSNR